MMNESELQAALALTTGHAGYDLTASVQTDVGCVREANEDNGRCFRPNDPRLLTDKGVLLIVADGMGGHASGEVASQMAVELISRLYYRDDGRDPAAALKSAVEESGRLIYAAAQKDERVRGMGTTCTAAVLHRGALHTAHVGDSRLYMIRGGEIYLMTEDHSAVMEMVKLGIITREEARHHEDKNVILRALGTAPEVEATSWEEPLPVRPDDRFLLCSDGLYDLVEDAEILQSIGAAGADLHSAGEQLIALAKARGGHDNITLVLVGILRADEGVDDANLRATRELEAVR